MGNESKWWKRPACKYCSHGWWQLLSLRTSISKTSSDTLGLNEQEVYKNVSGVLLSVYKDFLKFPLNAPTQKIIGWEIFVQSQSKHFIPVRKQVSKRRSNMHEIKIIRSLCFVNFWWNLRKCKHFFILSITKSCLKMLDCGIIFHFLINLFLRIFFSNGKKKNLPNCVN